MNRLLLGTVIALPTIGLIILGILIPTVFIPNAEKDCISTDPVEPKRAEIDCSSYHQYFREYLWQRGPEQGFLDVQEIKNADWPYYIPEYDLDGILLNVTSQNYLSPADSTIYTWWHRVIVLVPRKMSTTLANNVMIFNDRGDNRNADGSSNENATIPRDDKRTLEMAEIAQYTGTVAMVIKDNPNQPMFFSDDPKEISRREDQIIAYSWHKFMDDPEGDIDYVLQLPMTKAVTAGFRAVASYLKANNNISLEKYVISGLSKRGWTSWLSCAFDDACLGSAPIVFNMIDIYTLLHKQFQALGGWTYAFTPYWAENLSTRLDDPVFSQLECLVDLDDYSETYVEKDVPIYHTGATGDEFFLVQDMMYSMQGMLDAGVSLWQRFMHNVDHGLVNGDVYQNSQVMSIRIFYYTCMVNTWKTALPTYTWESSQNSTHGQIRLKVTSPHVPSRVKAYMADTLEHNPRMRRDYRLNAFDVDTGSLVPQNITWTDYPQNIEAVNEREWVITFAHAKPNFWRAFYGELDFEIYGGEFVPASDPANTWTISTPTLILPEAFAYSDCSGQWCYGGLV